MTTKKTAPSLYYRIVYGYAGTRTASFVSFTRATEAAKKKARETGKACKVYVGIHGGDVMGMDLIGCWLPGTEAGTVEACEIG